MIANGIAEGVGALLLCGELSIHVLFCSNNVVFHRHSVGAFQCRGHVVGERIKIVSTHVNATEYPRHVADGVRYAIKKRSGGGEGVRSGIVCLIVAVTAATTVVAGGGAED